jgi:hypothetical protein
MAQPSSVTLATAPGVDARAGSPRPCFRARLAGMNLRLCIIGDEERTRAAAIVSFAREHVYRPGPGATVPGHDPRYVLLIPLGLRCVFTFTEEPAGVLWRHLTVSVSGGALPHPAAVEMIAELFGFTGSVLDHASFVQEENCIAVVQKAEPEQASSTN